jgi:hypothetical protein
MMKKEIRYENGRYVVVIMRDNGEELVYQPFNPKTGKNFTDEEEARLWANEMMEIIVAFEQSTPEASSDETVESAERSTKEMKPNEE